MILKAEHRAAVQLEFRNTLSLATLMAIAMSILWQLLVSTGTHKQHVPWPDKATHRSDACILLSML